VGKPAKADKRRKYDAAFRAEAVPKLHYRWQQAQLVVEVGSVEVARDPGVCQLRALLKRAGQDQDGLKKALVSQML
jgi:transposase